MDKLITSAVTDVTLYFNGAEITRKTRVSVSKGKSRILLVLPSPTVVANSVKATLGDKAVLVSADYTVDHLRAPEETEYIVSLKEKKKRTEEKIKWLEAKNDTAASALELLKHNCRVGDESTFDASVAEQLVALYRSSVNSIKKEIFDNNAELTELRDELDRLNSALKGNAEIGERVGIVAVELFTDEDTDVDITLTYYDRGASWNMSYDLRAVDSDTPSRLFAKAKMLQSTREDWSEVFIKLSTGNPSVSGKKPAIEPWYLNFDSPKARTRFSAAREIEDCVCEAAEKMPDLSEYSLFEAPAKADETATALEFKLPAVYTVKTGEDGLTVDVFNETLDTRYVYYTVPKHECKVYLIARVSGWEKLDIVNGDARVFLGNTYIGTSYIDTNTTDDDLEISFGTVNFITVSRVKGKGMLSKTLFGGTVKRTVEWELIVKNLKKTAVGVEIHDQIPVSSNKDIEITNVETGGAEHDKNTGELVWSIELGSGETFKTPIKYTVEHPSDKRVVLE